MYLALFKKYAKPVDYKLLHRMIYRFFSLPFIWIFIKLKISPNLITLVGAFIRLVGLYFYFTFLKIPAIIFYLFGYLLDWCDGPVARAMNKSSKFGVKLESVTDVIIIKLFYLLLPIGLFLYYNEPNILIIAFSFFTLMIIRETLSLVMSPGDRSEFYYYGREVDSADKQHHTKESFKSKYLFLSKLFTAIINFNNNFFPFIILFNLNIIFAFYFFNILIELIRVLSDIRLYFLVKV